MSYFISIFLSWIMIGQVVSMQADIGPATRQRFLKKMKSPPSWPEARMIRYSGVCVDRPATASLIQFM
jgi:hypothetical protein